LRFREPLRWRAPTRVEVFWPQWPDMPARRSATTRDGTSAILGPVNSPGSRTSSHDV